ncbi:MAG: glycosyltransferase [Clostridia bacterium]|nr:glycosyltransferase [Clostridia bacterium]
MPKIYRHIPKINNDIFLSIIITFYNQEQFVNKCLTSVFSQQTNFSYEVIIIDDGSTDNTVMSVKEWITKYPNTIKLYQTNSTDNRKDQIAQVSRCRLLGVSNISGKYVTFLDGDDYYPCEKKIQLQLSMLEKFPYCCACLSSYISTVEGKDEKLRRLSCGTILKTKKYIEHYYLPSATMIYRNVPFVCYDDNFDDNSISFALLQSKRLCYLDVVTFCHYKTSNSSWISKDDNEKSVALIKNIDDAICYSSIRNSSILFRYLSFIVCLYKKRKQNSIYNSMISRDLSSLFMRTIIDYRNSSLFCKIYLKYMVYMLVLKYKFSSLRKVTNESKR